MSKPKFTPGPWKLEARRDYCDEFECWLHPINLHIHDKISDADAHLIAAAPELYEALKNTTAHLVAAHSLLQSGGQKAAASNTMFEIMLKDYEKSIEVGRAALKKLEDV